MVSGGLAVPSGVDAYLYDGIVRALRGFSPEPDLIMLVRHEAVDEKTLELWSNDEISLADREVIEAAVEQCLRDGTDLEKACGADLEDLSVHAAAVKLEGHPILGALVVARHGAVQIESAELAAVRAFAAMCASNWETEDFDAYRNLLDDLVVEVANSLMPMTEKTVQRTLDWTCERLASFLHADVSFLRFNDHEAGTSNLAAEWPHREDIPDPDPLGIVPFESDPMFEMLRDFKEPIIGAQSSSSESYRDIVTEARTDLPWSGAAVPLIEGDVTIGVLAFIYLEERTWTQSEMNALSAVASLIAQARGRVQAERRLVFQADHDEMTGLHNRRALLREIDRRLKRAKVGMALLFMDLDRFKIMNDFLGHNMGDQILSVAADRVRNSLRPGDFAARLGGDEFVILLDNEIDEFGAVAAANRLLDLCSMPIEVAGKVVSHTGSIGIVVCDGTETTSGQLLSNADVALYEAKRQGGNQAIVFDRRLSEAADERTNLEIMLREAIDNDELCLHFQPEIDLLTGEILAAEALVRWEHPERGMMNAAEFIKVAEESGLIVDLGRWIFDEACLALARILKGHPESEIMIRINVSPAELSVGGALDLMMQSIHRARIRPDQVCVEITEHGFIQDMDRAVETLMALRALGLSLAIDDFGTGFSSLTQLKELPFNVMKIDGSFVHGMMKNRDDELIVEACVNLGSAFDLDVVAEGIEVPAEIDRLLKMGCHRAQGYLLAKPMPLAALEKLLAAGPLDIAALGR